MKLCVYQWNEGNLEFKEKIPIIRVERHPIGMKKGWCKLHLLHGYIVCFHYKDIRKNVVFE